MINLNSFGRTYRDLLDLRHKIFEALGNRLYTLQSINAIVFNSLKEIDSVESIVYFDNSSLQNGCFLILKHFGLEKNLEVEISDVEFPITKKKRISLKENNDELDCILKFRKEILDLEKAPCHEYFNLQEGVNNDLLSLTELIRRYEKEPYIIKHNEKSDIPKNHSERILLDFYKRCLNERINILNFSLYKLKDKALSKSRFSSKYFSAISFVFWEKPYRYGKPFSIHYFDSKKIDKVNHRIGEFPISVIKELRNLYELNKSKFYEEYFKTISVEALFQEIFFYLPYLPIQYGRKIIFEELKILFNDRKWMAFYALALPQVEGLFSEMCYTVSPDEDFSTKTLTQKVNSVRGFHQMNDSYFDYYQYLIPIQRNKFTHTGFDEDFELKSYDLLIDLCHLLKIFANLDNPVVEIKKVHVRRTYEDFISIKEFVGYFNELENLKPSQRKDLKADIVKFEKEFLSKDCNIEFICEEIILSLPQKITEFYEELSTILKSKDIDLKTIHFEQLEEVLFSEENFEHIHYFYTFKNDEVAELLAFYGFLKLYKKHLPSLNSDCSLNLRALKSTFNKELNIVEKINSLLSKKRKENERNENHYS